MNKAILNPTVFFFALASSLAFTAAKASEAHMAYGTQEVSVQGNLDLDAQDDYQFNMDFSYGYFLKDNFEIGVQLDGTASDSYKNANFGFFTEYNFNNSTNWIPFIGAAASVGTANIDDNREGNDFDFELNDADALSIDLSLGFKYFVNENVAIGVEFIHTLSTDDIHFDGDEVKDSASNILFGTRFYF